MGMSRTPLYAKLKALTNMGVNDYINMIRIEKASLLLLHSTMNITEISEAVGFEYPRHFSTMFKQIKGMPPSQYRNNAEARIDSIFIKFEPIQIVLGNADDTEYADARRLFIFFKNNILSAFICARLRHLCSLIQTG